MSDEQRTGEDKIELRLTIHPEPTGIELVAILQALDLLGQSDEESSRNVNDEQAWEELARRGGVRARNWPYQLRCWSDARR